nr:protein FAR1-RELATED SEQUENCE 5-like [Aegilops tauschii subsp. strangulata]
MLVKLLDSRWEVIYFVAEHNHPLVDKPSLTKYLRSHQGIPPEERAFLTHLHNCNLTTGRMMHIMSDYYGTELIVPYGTKHISNLKSELNKHATKEGDMIETVAYFKDQQKEDPDFFYKIKYDEEDRVENIFWVDGAARKAYAEAYHDCISFDTTYMTNMYNMPFAPFIGINRHGQSFMLGCGFVRQELATSFDWLFGTFLEAMHGLAPTNIITDQDIAMAQSIKRMFPTSVHRCCYWHIMKKAQEKLGALLGRNPGLSEDSNNCIDFSLTPEEFEAAWVIRPFCIMLLY